MPNHLLATTKRCYNKKRIAQQYCAVSESIMKALSLARPLLIMIIGLPGAGKSYFARHFSDTFGAPLISADAMRFELFDTPQFNANEYGLIKRLLGHQLGELVKTKTSVLVDGICNDRKDRQALEQFAAQHGYGTMLVWVQTDEPTAKTRATSRNAKRPGDEFNSKISPVQFAAQTKQLNPPVKNEDYVVISGKHTYSTQAKMVLRKLAAPRVEKADVAYKAETRQVRAATPTATPSRTVQARRNVIIR
jgi:predicted kinase